MSEPLPRGAERDLFRDTWVRYLGECGGEGHGDSPTMWLERQGSPGAGQCPGEGGRIVVLILHGPETGLGEAWGLAQGHTAQVGPALRSGSLLASLPGERSSPAGRNGVSGLLSLVCLGLDYGVTIWTLIWLYLMLGFLWGHTEINGASLVGW